MRVMLGGRLRQLKRADPIPVFPNWAFYTNWGKQTPGRYTTKDGVVYCLLQVMPAWLNSFNGHPQFNPRLSSSRQFASFRLYRFMHPYTGASAPDVIDYARELAHWTEPPKILAWNEHWTEVKTWEPNDDPRRSLPRVLDELEREWPEQNPLGPQPYQETFLAGNPMIFAEYPDHEYV